MLLQNDSVKNSDRQIALSILQKILRIDQLKYGDKILINKKLQEIKNSGNPGAFNYQRYSAFQQIFHNVFLKKD